MIKVCAFRDITSPAPIPNALLNLLVRTSYHLGIGILEEAQSDIKG